MVDSFPPRCESPPATSGRTVNHFSAPQLHQQADIRHQNCLLEELRGPSEDTGRSRNLQQQKAGNNRIRKVSTVEYRTEPGRGTFFFTRGLSAVFSHKHSFRMLMFSAFIKPNSHFFLCSLRSSVLPKSKRVTLFSSSRPRQLGQGPADPRVDKQVWRDGTKLTNNCSWEKPHDDQHRFV